MKTLRSKALVLVAIATVSPSALANGVCTTEPVARWMSEQAIQFKIEALGYKVMRIQIDDNCYEIDAVDKQGKAVELEVNPMDASVVEVEYDSD